MKIETTEFERVFIPEKLTTGFFIGNTIIIDGAYLRACYEVTEVTKQRNTLRLSSEGGTHPLLTHLHETLRFKHVKGDYTTGDLFYVALQDNLEDASKFATECKEGDAFHRRCTDEEFADERQQSINKCLRDRVKELEQKVVEQGYRIERVSGFLR